MPEGARGRPQRPASAVAVGPVELATRLHSAAIHLLRRVQQEDRALGLTPARLSALSVLVFAGPRTLGELAKAERVTPPTITRLVGAMEAEGLVQRAGDAADGRVVRIAATAEGRRILLAGRERRVRAVADGLSDLDRPSFERLVEGTDVLERLVRGL